jgi:molybdopterin molybdotransferase
MKKTSLGLKEALSLTHDRIMPLPVEEVNLVTSIDRIVASDLYSLVDSPTMDASLKDGYAVLSHEVAEATPEAPVRLRLSGSLAAGGENEVEFMAGSTIRVLTGARIPDGADAVVAEEFVKQEGSDILVKTFAEPGRNILPRASDVAVRKHIISASQKITPGMTGLLAAAGHSLVPVVKNPVVAVIGTGDEIVAPGESLPEGKLYASNMVTLAAWCNKYKMKTRMAVVKDDYEALFSVFKTMSSEADAVITSGGAWTGDHDLVAHVLEGLGWEQIFHRIRIGPGKAVGFGMLDNKPVFILPGGPSSNLMGFLQIALPGLLTMSGHTNTGLPRIKARLAVELRGREQDWTHFFFGTLDEGDDLPVFYPLRGRSRLKSIAEANAVACISEGTDYIPAGSVVSVQLLG